MLFHLNKVFLYTTLKTFAESLGQGWLLSRIRLPVLILRANLCHSCISCLIKQTCASQWFDKKFKNGKVGLSMKAKSMVFLWKRPCIGLKHRKPWSYRALEPVSTFYDMLVIKGVLVCRCVDTALLRWLEEDK